MPSRSNDSSPDRIKGQTRIEGDNVGGGDTEGQKCDWCPEDATRSFEMRRRMKGGKAGATLGTGQFVFACDEHEEFAKKATEQPRPALRKK